MFLTQPVSEWVRNKRVSWTPYGGIGMWPGSLICFFPFLLSLCLCLDIGVWNSAKTRLPWFCLPLLPWHQALWVHIGQNHAGEWCCATNRGKGTVQDPSPYFPVSWEASLQAYITGLLALQLLVGLSVRSPTGDWKEMEASVDFLSPCGIATVSFVPWPKVSVIYNHLAT